MAKRTVRMLTLMAGPEGTVQVGELYTASEKVTRQLIDGGYAIAYEAPAVSPPETTEGQQGEEQATLTPDETK